MSVELKVPSAGESISEVQIGAWSKGEGDRVRLDETIVELETDKASMELPSPAAGVLAKVLKKQGDTARVGEVIAVIEEGAAATDGKTARRPEPAAKSPNQEKKETASPSRQPPSNRQTPVMPAAQRVMSQQGQKPEDVEPTGPKGHILKEDAERQARTRNDGKSHEGEEQAATGESAPEKKENVGAGKPRGRGDQEEVVTMSMLRRVVAQRLVAAQQQAALLTTFNECDMSAVMKIRHDKNEAFQKRYGVKLGFMSFFVKAAIDALKLIPQINAEVRENNIVYKNYYDIGVAVSTERGLVVPVLRGADRLSFAEIEKAIADFAERARTNRFTIEELQGGTFTISNGGVFGSLLSTPIVNPPQSGILGLHAIQDRPVAIEGQVVVRPMMYIALTYDHRIVDGHESVTFLKRIKDAIEDPTRMFIEV